jgi:hypothetical protein
LSKSVYFSEKRILSRFILIFFTLILLCQYATNVSAAPTTKLMNDYESLSLFKREHIMFQTYNAKLTFIGETYENKKVKLAFRVTGATNRIAFSWRVIFSDGSTDSNGLILQPEMRYYKDQTVYIYSVENPNNMKLARFDYTIDINNEAYKNTEAFEKTYILNTKETQKVFLSSIPGTEKYNRKTNYTVKNSDRTITINNVSLSKSSIPLNPDPQTINLFGGGPSPNIAYILTIDATTTSSKDNSKYNPYGYLNFASTYATSYSGGNNSPFSNSYHEPIGIFGGIPKKNKYTFNLTKSLKSLDTVANVYIDGAYFIIDLKTGLTCPKPSPRYVSIDENTYQWTPIKDGSGIWRVNTTDYGMETLSQDYYSAFIHSSSIRLNKSFNALSFKLSFSPETGGIGYTYLLKYLKDGYLNVYNSDNVKIDYDIDGHFISQIPQTGLIKSIHITPEMKPQDVVVNVKGLENVQIVYFAKSTTQIEMFSGKDIPSLLLSDLYIE